MRSLAKVLQPKPSCWLGKDETASKLGTELACPPLGVHQYSRGNVSNHSFSVHDGQLVPLYPTLSPSPPMAIPADSPDATRNTAPTQGDLWSQLAGGGTSWATETLQGARGGKEPGRGREARNLFGDLPPVVFCAVGKLLLLLLGYASTGPIES